MKQTGFVRSPPASRWHPAWEIILVDDGSTDFRLLDRRVVDALLRLPERNHFMKGLYAWLGFDARAVPYRPQPRAEGSSHYGTLKFLRLSVDALMAFTIWPLRVIKGASASCWRCWPWEAPI